MILENAYDAVKRRLDTMDFAALWRGFHPLPFALYDANSCFMDGAYLNKPAEFMANTAVLYGGRYVAIWNMESASDDMDALAASLAHEMFHAFQLASGESRWPDEMQALKHYPYSPGNLSGRLREAALMQRILQDGERARFPELLALRQTRANRFPCEYRYESLVEQIEGSALYVELHALEQLDAKKAAQRWDRLWRDLSQAERYLPTRLISYSTGAAFLACIRACSGYDFEAFTPVPYSQGILTQAAGAEKGLVIDADAARAIAAYQEQTRRIIDSAVANRQVVLQGCFPLVSLNIWDARFDGRYAVSNYFVAFRDNGEVRSLQGNFVVELDEADNLLTVYSQSESNRVDKESAP